MSQTPSVVWNNCLSFIKDNIQPQAYKTWFEPIIPVKLTDDVLSIQVPSKFFYEWLEEHYVKILRLALTNRSGLTSVANMLRDRSNITTSASSRSCTGSEVFRQTGPASAVVAMSHARRRSDKGLLLTSLFGSSSI